MEGRRAGGREGGREGREGVRKGREGKRERDPISCFAAIQSYKDILNYKSSKAVDSSCRADVHSSASTLLLTCN